MNGMDLAPARLENSTASTWHQNGIDKFKPALNKVTKISDVSYLIRAK